MLIKMQGKKLKDIYKREVNYGDYVLFNFSYCDELYNKAIGLYTDKGIYISDLLNLDSLFSSLPSTVCYKIENPLDLGLDLSDVNSLITLYYLKDLNYYSDIIDKPIVDIFGRRLGLGDFVIYKTVGYKFHYGIVIDDKHVFTSKLIKERATIVYKVITPTELELEIYNDLKLEYQKLQNLLIIGNFETKDRFKNLKKGGYTLYEKSGWNLIILGDIKLYKENNKNSSNCWQNEYTFDYHGIKNALCGKTDRFTPKRILVIQMK